MAITPKPLGAVQTPNTIPSESVGAVAIPNAVPAKPAADVSIPNSLPSKAVADISIPNTIPTKPVGDVAVPNVLNAESVGAVAIPNTLPTLTPAAFPRALCPLVSIDFVGQNYAECGSPVSFDDLFTYTRASTATFINRTAKCSGGYNYFVDTAPSNTLRFEYNPETGEALGALIEGSSTNIILRSEEFDSASWAKVGSGTAVQAVVTANFAEAPDGTMTADRIICDLNGSVDGSTSWVSQSFALTTPSTISIWAKLNTGVSATVVLSNNSSETITINSYEWKRFSVSAVSNFAGAFRFGLIGSAVGITDIVDILIWGAQVEQGLFATSYIATTSAAVTRSPDNLNIDPSLIVGTNKNIEQSVNMSFDILGVSGNVQKIFATNETTNFAFGSFGSDISGISHGNAVVTVTSASTIGSISAMTKTYNGADCMLYFNGELENTQAVGTSAAAKTLLGIGSNGASGEYLFGHISKFTTYDVELTAQEVYLL